MNFKRILGASLGECIHVAGVLSFLRLAKEAGHNTDFLGPAVSVEKLIQAIKKSNPDIVAVSYRLTPETAIRLIENLNDRLAENNINNVSFVFGGPPPVAEFAKKSGLFDEVFSGEEPPETIKNYLLRISGRTAEDKQVPNETYPDVLVERIHKQEPHPLLRHHLGLETVEITIDNAHEVALSGELDVLSIAPDQNAQEYFFRPDEMPKTGDGAGGVPLRKPEDLRGIFNSTRCGNYPLLRCYAGTRDLIKWAEMCVETINMAWGAIPVFWYSELDKRSNRLLEEAIRENHQTIRWYAGKGIPVEVNDSHQWSLRDAHDAVAVASAYLGAYNAKSLGVRYYVSQYMLNTPPETSPAMDIAKMLAKIEMIESLHDRNFTSFREVRTGLRSMVADMERAKGHLMASITTGMMLHPHIVHVVGYCEADHAATAKEIISSCRMTRGAINLALKGLPNAEHDNVIIKRKRRLISEANVIIDALKQIHRSDGDPLTDPVNLAKAVRKGILDAPHLCGSGVAPGEVITCAVNGGYTAINPKTGRPINEKNRLKHILRV